MSDTAALEEELNDLDVTFPEWTDSAMGDRVFQDQDGYFELLESWRALRRAEIAEELANG